MAFATEFDAAFGILSEKINTGAADPDVMASFVAVSEVLRRWRANSETLQETVTNSEHIDSLQRKLAELADQREILARLESEAGTRVDQANSVNPKVTPSPYTNILGLQRTFRSSARSGLTIAGIVFAVLAVAVLGFLVFRLVVAGVGTAFTTATQAGGGGKVSGGGR